ncbi:MAG TPA: hypothetical protein VEH76_04080 [Methylocystis sp.]|nr:hypothetical protein [Methylocystis sp.]
MRAIKRLTRAPGLAKDGKFEEISLRRGLYSTNAPGGQGGSTMLIWFESRKAKKSRVDQALAGYPFYDRPNKKRPKSLSQVQENFAYFQCVREERLRHFQDWLRQSFNVDATLDASGASAVSGWADRDGGAILGEDDQNEYFFPFFSKSWTPEHPGYSVIFDLGIYVGEMIVAKRPGCRWALTPETPGKSFVPRSLVRSQPSVFYRRGGEGLAPFNVAWGSLADKHRGIPSLGGRKACDGGLMRWVRTFLYVVRNTDPKLFSPKEIDKESFDVIAIGKEFA